MASFKCMISDIYRNAYFLGTVVNCHKTKGNFQLTHVCPPTYPQKKWMSFRLSHGMYHAQDKQNRGGVL